MRKIMVVIAGLAIAAGAYLAGTAGQAHQDGGHAQQTVQLYRGPIGGGR